MSIIRRGFADKNVFAQVINDFQFLVEKIKKSGYEYNLELRKNYLNLYYRGNSIGKIEWQLRNKRYKIEINKKFLKNNGNLGDFNGKENNSNNYVKFYLKNKQLKSFYNKDNLKFLFKNVREVGYKEEITFEQILMADNMNRKDFIIIDRQISEHNCNKPMDILALKKNDNGNYQFCVIEVKLGNNPELKDKVYNQISGYIERIKNNYDAYTKCYTKVYNQKKQLKIFDDNMPVNIEIEANKVLGLIVVGGYMHIAEQYIQELEEHTHINDNNNIYKILLSNKLELNKPCT